VIFQADRCALLGIRTDRKFCWVTHASYGEGIEPVSGISILRTCSRGPTRACCSGATLIFPVGELPTEAETNADHGPLGIRSALTVPLSVEGRVSS
jgi:hypothetical protein